MALTFTKVFVSELRIRYQLDATADDFGDTKTLTQIIADTVPGELRDHLTKVASGIPFATADAAMAGLFAQGDLRFDIPPIGSAIGKITGFGNWGINVSLDGNNDAEFFPSATNGGGRAYLDVYLIHSVNG
jgi:hypothetical protein